MPNCTPRLPPACQSHATARLAPHFTLYALPTPHHYVAERERERPKSANIQQNALPCPQIAPHNTQSKDWSFIPFVSSTAAFAFSQMCPCILPMRICVYLVLSTSRLQISFLTIMSSTSHESWTHHQPLYKMFFFFAATPHYSIQCIHKHP